MYEEHFGFKVRPFKSAPTGTDVFIGPQTAGIIQQLKASFTAADSIALVSGAAGLGKTTLVAKALSAFDQNMTVLQFPRVKLAHDEVVDFVLEKLGVTDLPDGLLRRAIACRDTIADEHQAGRRICVVVEDAERIGADALIELEALTCTDGQTNPGAHLVFIGSDTVADLFACDAMQRIHQRTRMRFEVQPFDVKELRAYLKHCFRLAGGEFDTLFTEDALELLYELSAGVPRVVNNLVDGLLEAAAEHEQDSLPAAFIRKIATEQFGLECSADTSPPNPITAEKRVLTVGTDESPAVIEPGNSTHQDVKQQLPDLDELAPGLASVAPIKAVEPDPLEAEIPTLFSSQRLKMPQLLNETVAAAVTEPELPAAPDGPSLTRSNATEGSGTDETNALHVNTTEPSAESLPEPDTMSVDATPEWDRDPTLAELRPDLEALEMAMADFPEDEAPIDAIAPTAEPLSQLDVQYSGDVPEITLDTAIKEKIAEATEALEQQDATLADETIEDRPKSDATIKPENTGAADGNPLTDTIADGISSARSIEDMDDRMAETLFGSEFSALAEATVPPVPMPSTSIESPVADPSDESSIILELIPDDNAPASPAIVDDTSDDQDTESALEREFREVYGDNALEVSLQSDTPSAGLDLSASQRLATVRALNASKRPPAATKASADPKTNGGGQVPNMTPQSIEDQINTSMTQTLRTLNARPHPANDDAGDDDNNPKGGFFRRFRRT